MSKWPGLENDKEDDDDDDDHNHIGYVEVQQSQWPMSNTKSTIMFDRYLSWLHFQPEAVFMHPSTMIQF